MPSFNESKEDTSIAGPVGKKTIATPKSDKAIASIDMASPTSDIGPGHRQRKLAARKKNSYWSPRFYEHEPSQDAPDNDTASATDSFASCDTGGCCGHNDDGAERIAARDRLLEKYNMRNPDSLTGFKKLGLRFLKSIPKGFANPKKPLSGEFIARFKACKATILHGEEWASHREMWLQPFKEDGLRVDKIVVVATGSFYNKALHGEDELVLWIYELACVAVIAQLLRQKQGDGAPLRVYLQEPKYTAADARILRAVGKLEKSLWQIVEHPRASAIMDRKTFVWSRYMVMEVGFDILHRDTDIGVLFATGAENLMLSEPAFWIRQNKANDGEDDCDVEGVMFEWLQSRKARYGDPVMLKDLPEPEHSNSWDNRLFLRQSNIYWLPPHGDRSARTDEQVQAAVEKARVQYLESAMESALSACPDQPPTEEQKRTCFQTITGEFAAKEVDEPYDSVSPRFRRKWDAIKTEIRTGEAWAATRNQVIKALSQSSSTCINKVVFQGGGPFGYSIYHGSEGVETWFYNFAWGAVLVDLVAEQRGVKPRWIIDNGLARSQYENSRKLFSQLGAELLKEADVAEQIDGNTMLSCIYKVFTVWRGAPLTVQSRSPAIYMGPRVEDLLAQKPVDEPTHTLDGKASILGFLRFHQAEDLGSSKPDDDERVDGIQKLAGSAIYWPVEEHEIDVEAFDMTPDEVTFFR